MPGQGSAPGLHGRSAVSSPKKSNADNFTERNLSDLTPDFHSVAD